MELGPCRRITQPTITTTTITTTALPVCMPPGLAEGPLAPARSAYDVFNSLGRVARGLAISARERLEQVAYSLLAGQFSVL